MRVSFLLKAGQAKASNVEGVTQVVPLELKVVESLLMGKPDGLDGLALVSCPNPVQTTSDLMNSLSVSAIW